MLSSNKNRAIQHENSRADDRESAAFAATTLQGFGRTIGAESERGIRSNHRSRPRYLKRFHNHQGNSPHRGRIPQETGQDQGDRPKLRLPDDKPLGAAGPNRNRKPSPEEDADFIIIKDRWRIGVPEDPRFRKGSIFDPYHQNVLKGDYPIIGNDIFMNLNFASETFFNFRQLPTCQA